MGWKWIVVGGATLFLVVGVVLVVHSEGVEEASQWAGIVSMLIGLTVGVVPIIVSHSRKKDSDDNPRGNGPAVDSSTVNNTISGNAQIKGNVTQAHSINRKLGE